VTHAQTCGKKLHDASTLNSGDKRVVGVMAIFDLVFFLKNSEFLARAAGEIESRGVRRAVVLRGNGEARVVGGGVRYAIKALGGAWLPLPPSRSDWH
jgi:hypothetical protein